MTFERWMDQVDRILASMCGFTSSDLADIAYWDMWHDGASPQEAAEEALNNEGFPFDEEW